MDRLNVLLVSILVLGLFASLAGIASGEHLNELNDLVVSAFSEAESAGIRVEFVVFALMILESAGILVPSEVVMPLGGFLASQGLGSLTGVILAGSFGNLVGSLIAYYVGRRAEFVEQRFPDIVEAIRSRGSFFAFITRLTPGVRTYAPFALGAAEVDVKRFAIYTFVGSLIRATPRAYIGYVLGENRPLVIEYFHRRIPLVLAIVIDAIVVAIRREKTRGN